MDVEAAEPRRIEDGLRQQQAIGHDHRRIGLERREARLFLGAFSETGVRTSMPCAAAKAWTGEGRSAMPRPAGRGGWE